MSDFGAPPVIPASLQVYDSYATDPIWQRYFTYAWVALAGTAILLCLPALIRSARTHDLFHGYFISESLRRATPTKPIPPAAKCARAPGSTPRRYSPIQRTYQTLNAVAQSALLPSIPTFSLHLAPLRRLTSGMGTTLADCCRKSYLGLTVGQMILVAAYAALVGVCIGMDSELSQNGNRAGFLALAQLTPLILLSVKNNPLGLALGLGYEKLNFAHRWAGRLVWLSATIHGGLWLQQFASTGQKDQLTSDKTLRGIASWVLLTCLAISSIKPVRRRWYQVFFALHVMSFSGFFAAVAYHSPYAKPWIWPPIALYATDLFMRLLRYRIKDAMLVPVGGNMTLIHVPDCDAGWLPTQHVWLRVLATGGIFESHPFTITNAPPAALRGLDVPRGITLYAKACGGWTSRLREVARTGAARSLEEKEALVGAAEGVADGCEVKVILDGPYGGLKLDLDRYETVLLVAGGSGVTFMLGCIEEALRKGMNGGGPKRLECVWVVKDMDTIEAMAPTLSFLDDQVDKLPSLELIYNLYLTQPPRPLPTGVASMPTGTKLQPYRPDVSQLVQQCMPPPTLPELEDGRGMRTCCSNGGVAVIACGPESIVAESRNAVAGLGIGERVRAGGVEFFGECYAI